VPADVKGKIKVVGLLEGWPFPVQQDPTEVDPKLAALGGGVEQFFRVLQTAFSK